MADLTAGKIEIKEPIPMDIIFYVGSDQSREVLRICPNGDFFVNGNKVENDYEIYLAFVRFLQGAGCYYK